jgi:tetratricopeptide (TPR) repeat protein
LVPHPNVANFLDSRGFVLLRMGRYDDAIASYDAALQQQSKSASLYGRGIAKRRRGDTRGGDADLKAARDLDTHVSAEFAAFGVTP